MGTVSLEKMNHLFWLGRYTERVYTTLRLFDKYFDAMIDEDPQIYKTWCIRLSIPDIYADVDDFVGSYLFSAKNPDSMYANLSRAFDNAVVIREELSSEVLSYIQMSLDVLKSSADSPAPMMELQRVQDYLLAFWGGADDYVDNEESRNIMKCGKYVERLDLYFRFGYPVSQIVKEYTKLKNRMGRISLSCAQGNLDRFMEIACGGNVSVQERIRALELLGALVEV